MRFQVHYYNLDGTDTPFGNDGDCASVVKRKFKTPEKAKEFAERLDKKTKGFSLVEEKTDGALTSFE